MKLRSWLLLFRLPITRRSEADYDVWWDAQLEHQVEGLTTPFGAPNREGLESLFAASEPRAFPYNDLYGFAEVFWDGGARFIANLYFRGDGRTRAGKGVKAWLGGLTPDPRKVYLHTHMKELAKYVPPVTQSELRACLLEALDEASRLAENQKGYLVAEEAQRLVSYLDLKGLLTTSQ